MAATAALIRWRCEQLGALPPPANAPTPVLDAMFSRDEPHTGTVGTLAWAVDIDNPASGERFTLTLKEVTLPAPDGGTTTRPCALGFSGNYPRALDGLARLLSLDMRVIDPAWIGMKLRKLLNYAEPLGHFMAFVPGLRTASGASRPGRRPWPTSRGWSSTATRCSACSTSTASRCARWACSRRPRRRRQRATPVLAGQALPRMRQRHA